MNPTTLSCLEDYKKLNTAQKKAVDTTEGAVLVVAGPGTGKTQILAARIAKILENQDVQAANILCMTYTDAGVVAMRNRLVKFIGSEAYKVNVHTFHSFCNRVIQENSDYFGIREVDPMTELDRIALLEKLVDGLEKNNPLKRWRGDIYYDVTSGRLHQLFQLMKSENLDAEAVENAVTSYIESLETNPKFIYKQKSTKNGRTFQKGDVKIFHIEEEKEAYKKLIAAAKELSTYERLKKEKGLYDFEDMIQWVMKAFEENEGLLLNYQERFQYVLVDEYQDTNGSQNKIFRQLISYWDNPNAFVVGDDDQSIYRFQGANLGNIMAYYTEVVCPSYASPEEQKERVIVLTNNYRSTQAILDLSKNSIEKNEERLIKQLKELELNKDLVASGEIRSSAAQPKIVSYYNSTHEMLDIAMQIEKLRDEGVNLNDVAVIYNKHNQAEEILQYLNQQGVPVRTKRRTNILHSTLTLQLLDILQYLNDESKIPHTREDLLFKMFHFEYFHLNPLQVARLAFELRENRYKNPKCTWREALHSIQVELDKASIKQLHHWSNVIEQWMKDMQNMPLQLFFQKMIEDLALLPYLLKHPEKVWLLQELKTLFDFIKLENQKHAKLNVTQFIDLIKTMNTYKIALEYTRSTYAESAVNFTSAHGAKGLEFKHVFILGVNKNVWDAARNNKGFKLPPGLFQKESAESEMEEKRRLFYVAMTRAEEHLQISYVESNDGGKQLNPSQFVVELLEKQPDLLEKKHFKDDPVIAFTMQQFGLPKLPNPEILEAAYFTERLQQYSMSVTHLNNYLKCPLKFYYQNFLQVPSAKNSAMAFGSAIHNALEQFYKEMLANEETFPTKEELLQIAERKLYGQEDSFTAKEYQQKLDYIQEFIPKYYDNYIENWTKNVVLEKRLYGVFENIELNGALDKIEFNGNAVNIVDYKTGQHATSKKYKKFSGPVPEPKDPNNPKFEEVHGGDYWRQAVFYKLLIDYNKDLSQQHWEYNSTLFDFVEPDATSGTFHVQKVVITPEDMNIVKHQIKDTYKNIKALNFKGCGEEDCEWCQLNAE